MESNINSTHYGKCRFCLAKGKHRDLMKEYNYEGIREVYFDIVHECFNVYLITNTYTSTLICTLCVQKLREASTFRMMVVSSEQTLLDTDENQTLFVNVGREIETDGEVKVEAAVKFEESGIEQIADDGAYNSDCYSSEGEELVDGEAEFLARFPRGSLKPLPTKETLHLSCTEFARHLESLKGQVITSKSLESFLETKPNNIGNIYLTEKTAHITNITTILEHSNLTAFRTKRRLGLPCFYCRKTFENFDKLHIHQDKERCKRNVKKLLVKLPSESLVVYVFVTDLKCTICDQNVPNLNELKGHLTKTHKKKMYPEYGDRVIPFKLSKNEYECQICGCHFETFGSIERHMNVHYRNYVCDQCGAGYVTKNRLKVHIRYSHVSGAFPCGICKKVFATQYKYKSHVDAVHKMVKKNKCPKCPERFSDYFNRHKHMVDVHGDPPLRYKCNVCDTLFKRRYALSCHIKRRHLELRDIQCALCSYKCYTTTELKVHMIKHNGERTYECMVCQKSYARKKTLKEHMRIHNNDRRYICVVCGQGFVQNCSLKGHMKAHHFNYVNGVLRG